MNCIVTENDESPFLYCGAGVLCCDASAHFTNVEFSINCCLFGGSGMGLYRSPVVLSGWTFRDNRAGGGAGIYAYESSPIMVDCEFTLNIDDPILKTEGGGLHNSFSSSSKLIRCVFSENRADVGGGIYSEGNLELEECEFTKKRSIAEEKARGSVRLKAFFSLASPQFL